MSRQVTKMIGSDAEFANYIRGRAGDTCPAAVRLLLAAIPGVRAARSLREDSDFRENLTDMARRFLPNGGCFYNDSEHCEGPTPEVLGASQFVHYWRAVLLRLQQAAARVNRRLPKGERLCVRASNSDGFSNSWASHLNILLTRECFDALFQKPLHFLWLASFQATSQIYAGAGKVGSENGAPPCRYQLSQRGGDFFEVLSTCETMRRRGLLNTRDQSHAGSGLARLHCIYYDSTLADHATYLKTGALQLACAMLEVGRLDSSVLLQDPLLASQTISHSLGQSPLRTLLGEDATALDIQYRILDAASRFVADGLAEGIVPEADTILTRWAEVLDWLRKSDLEKLARRLDWAAKLGLIEAAAAAGRLAWDTPKAKVLDHAYASLDEREGLFLALVRDNRIDRLTDPRTVAACIDQPPEDTRAYARSRLLALGCERAIQVDWDRIKFLVFDRARSAISVRGFDMSDPLFWSKHNTQQAFDSAAGLEDALEKLDALRGNAQSPGELEDKHGRPTY